MQQTSVTHPTSPSPFTYRVIDGGYLLVLQPGQKVIESLTAFMQEQDIDGASFNAIGAVTNVRLGYYDFAKQEYLPLDLRDDSYEVVAYHGNLGWIDEKPMVHSHMAIGDSHYNVRGGHLMEAEVKLVLEIFIQETGIRLERQKDPKFKNVKSLNLSEPTH